MNPKNIMSGCGFCFDVGLAEHLGLPAAIIFSHIFHLRNKATLENINIQCGDYFSKKEITRALNSLVDNDFIKVDGDSIILIYGV